MLIGCCVAHLYTRSKIRKVKAIMAFDRKTFKERAKAKAQRSLQEMGWRKGSPKKSEEYEVRYYSDTDTLIVKQGNKEVKSWDNVGFEEGDFGELSDDLASNDSGREIYGDTEGNIEILGGLQDNPVLFIVEGLGEGLLEEKTVSKQERIARIKEKIVAKKKSKIKESIGFEDVESFFNEFEEKEEMQEKTDRKAKLAARIREAIKQARSKKVAKATMVEGKKKELKNQAILLKEKINALKKSLKESEFGMEEPVEDSMLGEEPLEAGSAIVGEGGEGADLPADVVAQIQNIAQAVEGLAAAAGLTEENPAEGDIDAAIPPAEGQIETDEPVEGEEAFLESGWRKRVASANGEVDKMKEKVEARRAKIKAIRSKILEKKKAAAAKEDIPAVDDGSGMVDQGAQLSQAKKGKEGGVDGLNGTGGKFQTAKAGDTWPTKPTKSVAGMKEEMEAESEEDLEEMDESWAGKQEERFVEKRQLSFKKFFKDGLLG